MVTNVFVVQDAMATNVKVSTYLHVSTFIYNKAALNTEKSLIKKYLYRCFVYYLIFRLCLRVSHLLERTSIMHTKASVTGRINV